jgi:pimeloyl-ACP methyl ester carboxylesterase
VPTVELSSGRMHYDTAGPEDGRRVVCIHGYMMASSLWRPLSGLLAERGLRCLTPTWPLGAHTEPMRPEAELTMESVAALVWAFLAALNLDDVILLGVDTGGAIARIRVRGGACSAAHALGPRPRLRRARALRSRRPRR